MDVTFPRSPQVRFASGLLSNRLSTYTVVLLGLIVIALFMRSESSASEGIVYPSPRHNTF